MKFILFSLSTVFFIFMVTSTATFYLDTYILDKNSTYIMWWHFLIIFIFLFFSYPLVPQVLSKPSDLILWCLYLFVFIPSLLVLPWGTSLVLFDELLYCAFVLFCLFIIHRVTSAPSTSVPRFRLNLSSSQKLSCLLIIAVLSNISLVLVYGARFYLPSILEVYEVRSEFKGAISSRGGIFSTVLLRWTAYVINPMVILLALSRRWFPIVILASVMQLYIFGIAGLKSIALSVFLLPILYVFLCSIRSVAYSFFVTGISVFIFIIFLISYSLDQRIYMDLAVRRAILVPGQLSAYYFEYFSHSEKFQFSVSRTLGLFNMNNRAYSVDIPALIGYEYFGRKDASSNANIFADAFANFGYFGMILFSTGLAIFLRILNSTSREIDVSLTSAVCFLQMVNFTNSSLTTILLGHGFIFLLILIHLLPQGSIISVNENQA